MLKRFAPQGFTVGPEGVHVQRQARPVGIPLDSIRSARVITAGKLPGWPVWALGGIYGNAGYFYARKLGFYLAYVTDPKQMLLIEAERPYLLGPEQPEEFVRQLRAWLPNLPPAKSTEDLTVAQRGRVAKAAVLGAALFLALPVAVALFSLYLTHRYVPQVQPLKMPEGLNTPTVIRGEGFFSKAVLYQADDSGPITDIRYGDVTGDSSPELVLVSRNQAVFLTPTRQITKRVQFQSQSAGTVMLVDIDRDRTPEFLNRGAWAHEVILFNSDGSVRWTYGEGLPGVDDSAAGDLDGDGLAEIVVGFNGDGGLHLLDVAGRVAHAVLQPVQLAALDFSQPVVLELRPALAHFEQRPRR